MTRNLDHHTITDATVARHAQASDARLREVMTALVRHLHDFARETRLTEPEWLAGIRFLTAAGHITDEQRNEFILLSDVLGLSTLVTAQNHSKPAGCTEATVLGPFRVAGAPHFESGADIANGAKGEPCVVRGTVKDQAGQAIESARIEVWQADAEGLYDVQHGPHAGHRARGVFTSAADGSFRFRSIVAEAYPIPHDGPVGALLEKLGRHAWRPAHLHFMIDADGCDTLVTHVFRAGDRYLDSDAVFGVRSSLVADWVRHDAQPAPYYTLDFDFVLERRD